MRSILFAAAAGALLCSPAFAGESTAAQSDEEKIVCKPIDATSTRIARKKACMTNAQWKRDAERQSKEMRNRQGGDAIGQGGNVPRDF